MTTPAKGLAGTLPVLLLSALLFSCGGGSEYSPAASASVAASVNCMHCHATTPPTDSVENISADIVDTHFDDWRITEGTCSADATIPCLADSDCAAGDTCSGVTFATDRTAPLEGYALDNCSPGAIPSWASGRGFARRYKEPCASVPEPDTAGCATACHDYHNESALVNRQWASSGHADTRAEAFTHDFTVSADPARHQGQCMRCHSGIGYANYVDVSNANYPDWAVPPDELFPHHVTCNACHDDAKGRPSRDSKNLRKVGTLTLVSGFMSTAVRDATISAGTSATCITCHQGRESGWSLYKTIVNAGADPYDGIDTSLAISLPGPHYLVAGATLFGVKGYETPTKTYTPGNPFHQTALCTGCHMADSSDETLGGHTTHMANGEHQNITVCRQCHGPSAASFETIGNLRDMDGDCVQSHARDEIDGLSNAVSGALALQNIFYNPSVYPYFFTTPAPEEQNFGTRVTTWSESQLGAAFNLMFIGGDPGAYVHNFRYAVQLLRDSLENLNPASLPLCWATSVRPSTGDDRPAQRYDQ